MFYIIRNIFPTTRQVELIRKKKFAIVVLDPGNKTFIIHVVAFSTNSDN